MSNGTMRKAPTPTAVVLVAEGSEEIETLAPADILARAGVGVVVASTTGIEMTGSRGLPLRADRLVGALRSELFDAVVVPGGNEGARNIAASPPALQLIRNHADAGRLIAAICAAPAVVLGPMGLLDGKRATGYPTTLGLFPESATYVDAPTAEDCDLITGQGPGSAIAFGLAVAKRLAGAEAAERVAEEMLVDDGAE